MKTILAVTLNLLLITVSYSQSYYPLEVGNRWDYGYMDSPGHFVYQRTVSIRIDTTMPNGKTYAVFSDGSYQRQQGDTVYTYSPTQGESLLYDFSKGNGDTIKTTYYPNDTETTIVQKFSETWFGKSRTVWAFTTTGTNISVYEYISIADSIGYVAGEFEGGFGEECIGAIINGVQYGILTAVSSVNNLLPTQSRLSQNYPNPFNPSTQINYTIPKASNVTLKIYDILGREIATLVSGKNQPGEHSVSWNALNVPSGVYFYRIIAGDFVQTKKMLLMK